MKNNNNLLLFFLSILFTTQIFTQTPEKLSYQAVIRNANQELVTETNVGVQISILQGTATGNSVYTETHTATTNTNGLLSIAIGNGTTTDNFATIDWSQGPYFIKTETDPTGYSNYTITGTSQLLSVPFALHAKTVASISTQDEVNLSNLSGTNTGDQDISGIATNADAILVNSNSISANSTKITEANTEIITVKSEVTSNTSTIASLNTTITNLQTTINNMVQIPAGTKKGDLLTWNGSAWELLPVGDSSSILSVSEGVPSWSNSVISDNNLVAFGYESVYNELSVEMRQIYKNELEIEVKTKRREYQLDPNVTSLALLYSTSSNPIPSNSEVSSINLAEFNNPDSDRIQLNLTNLKSDTRYYFRLIINDKFISPNADIISSTTHPKEIGDTHAGGIITYIAQPYNDDYIENQFHGYVAATEDIGVSAPWGCAGTSISNMITGGSHSSTKSQNTALLAGCTTSGIAAKICADWTFNGYSDWLLPSKDLLSSFRDGRVKDKFTFSNEFYWSVTPVSNDLAWASNPTTGKFEKLSKSNSYRIRAVRKF
ncbi:uncharacterized protein DUF1566 [Jejuia pallidilutea]|uniref:Uncharacterized protein DUF1566 n=1 Tax=Jejuia pallidilutea TaxID=504487 RepID=A0A362X2R9_9FLAO|nr:DUF1566 domain-containing protein [Jejuia pallidilutea]PQV50542.1 uncharacterized protein DUF1566 [Jejuia pallidilutea]